MNLISYVVGKALEGSQDLDAAPSPCVLMKTADRRACIHSGNA